MDVLLSWDAPLMHVNKGGRFKTIKLATCEHFLLAGSGCQMQMGHNDMTKNIGDSFNYFSTANNPAVRTLCVCEGSHHYVLYPLSKKRSVVDDP